MTFKPDPNFQIFNEDMEFKLKEISDSVAQQVPPGWGFTVLLCSFGPNSELFWMTNVEPASVIAMFKKYIELYEKRQNEKTDG